MRDTADTLLKAPAKNAEPKEAEPENAKPEATDSLGVLTREFHFPTGIYFRDFPDQKDLNARLIPRIRALKCEDEKGVKRSNIPELGGWHSHVKLEQDPAFAALASRLKKTIDQVSADAGYHPDYELFLDTMWAIINPPGSYNRSHVHPRCLWSGVYYLQVPENSGRISFADPRLGKLMMDPHFHPDRKRKPEHWAEVYFRPRPGRAILFPSWLYHSVEPNTSDAEGDAAERIIISFNFKERRKPGV